LAISIVKKCVIHGIVISLERVIAMNDPRFLPDEWLYNVGKMRYDVQRNRRFKKVPASLWNGLYGDFVWDVARLEKLRALDATRTSRSSSSSPFTASSASRSKQCSEAMKKQQEAFDELKIAY